jgi:hypothetical protein
MKSTGSKVTQITDTSRNPTTHQVQILCEGTSVFCAVSNLIKAHDDASFSLGVVRIRCNFVRKGLAGLGRAIQSRTDLVPVIVV